MNVELRALDSSCIETIRGWRNDPRIMRWCRQSTPLSDLDQQKWFKRQAEDPTIMMRGIFAGAGCQLSGVCGLTSLDWLNCRAEFSCYTNPDKQKLGIGRLALTALFDHAFYDLGLIQVYGETFEGNPALKLFGELGLREDGIRRDFYWKNGNWLNAHLISILAEDWRASRDVVRGNDDPFTAPKPPAFDLGVAPDWELAAPYPSYRTAVLGPSA